MFFQSDECTCFLVFATVVDRNTTFMYRKVHMQYNYGPGQAFLNLKMQSALQTQLQFQSDDGELLPVYLSLHSEAHHVHTLNRTAYCLITYYHFASILREGIFLQPIRWQHCEEKAGFLS